MPQPAAVPHLDAGQADAALSALATGRVSATAGQCQRDLLGCAARYPTLFPAKPFDPALYSTVALANSFCAPWLSADRLRMANRASLWAFGVDWLIDYLATSDGEVDAIVQRCVAVAEGAAPPPDDPITEFLAELRTDLVAAPAFAALSQVWYEEFRLMLAAMAREWRWQAARQSGDSGALPSLDEYLDNADNICFSFVFVSHWVFAGRVPAEHTIAPLRAGGRLVQQVIRLLNDLGTYDRDVAWGDLNALMLGVGRDDVLARIGAIVTQCRQAFEGVRADEPELVTFLDRYIGFNTGFYGITDYWGVL